MPGRAGSCWGVAMPGWPAAAPSAGSPGRPRRCWRWRTPGRSRRSGRRSGRRRSARSRPSAAVTPTSEVVGARARLGQVEGLRRAQPGRSPAGPTMRSRRERPLPAVLMLSEACPWPFIAIEGIQKKRGLEPAVSNSVPDWVRVGGRVQVPDLVPARGVPVAAAAPDAARVDADVVRGPEGIGAVGALGDHRLEEAVVERVDPADRALCGNRQRLGRRGQGTDELESIGGVPPGSLTLTDVHPVERPGCPGRRRSRRSTPGSIVRGGLGAVRARAEGAADRSEPVDDRAARRRSRSTSGSRRGSSP